MNRSFLLIRNPVALLLATLLAVGGAPYSFAQTLPVCSAQFYDADGDGFGWENSASCVITESSIPAPIYFNRELNQQVEPSRVYWDGNTDIANRMIQCDRFHFDESQQRYAFVDYTIAQDPQTYEAAGVSEFRYFHQSIPPHQPFVGWFEGYVRTDAEFNKRATRKHPV